MPPSSTVTVLPFGSPSPKGSKVPKATMIQNVSVVKVGVVDENELIRDGLSSLLNHSQEFVCAGSWAAADEALMAVAQDPAHVLLVDSRLREQSAFELLRALVPSNPPVRVIVMVDCQDDRCVLLNQHSFGPGRKPLSLSEGVCSEPDDCLQTALKMGARGVLRKASSFETISAAIRKVADGYHWIEPSTAVRLARQYLVSLGAEPVREKRVLTRLTLRERQIVSLIAHGHSNKEITAELNLGYSTVKNHVSSILDKLGLSDRTQIALYAVEANSPDGNNGTAVTVHTEGSSTQ